MAAGLGVAVGALLLRVSDVAIGTPPAGPITAYGLTFVLLAVIMIQPLVQAIRLHRGRGRRADPPTRRRSVVIPHRGVGRTTWVNTRT